MYYAEYNNSNEEDEISKRLKKEYEDNNKYVVSNNNVDPVYDNYFKPQSGFCNMSFGGLIKENKTSTIIIPVNADLNYDNDCKMGYNTTLLIPITVPAITENSPVVIIPVVTQQNVNNNNNNIVSTAIQQPILEAKLENEKISVKPIDNITNISENTQIVTAVTNINETPNKIETTTITSLPIKPEDNKKVVTESNVINTDISGSNTKTNTNILISQTCLNGTLQCDVKQQIDNLKSDASGNFTAYAESSRTVIDLSSGEISLYKKNEAQNISSVPTQFIINNDISNNLDISKNIMLVNENSTLKVEIPINAPTIVKVDVSGEVINTTSQPIKITTRDPCVVQTLIERFTLDNIEGFSVIPQITDAFDKIRQNLPEIEMPAVFTNLPKIDMAVFTTTKS
jgi:hypothetical protein